VVGVTDAGWGEDGRGVRFEDAAVVKLRCVETFEVFYRRELPSLVALARSLSGSSHADDIAQEAMLAAYQRWDTVSRLELPVGWVRRVCANMAVSVVRRRAVEARGLLRLGSQASPVEVLADQSAEFWSQVRRLPRRQAQVIALHYLFDLGVGDIAATLGCAPGTVKAHLARGRAVLARQLDQPPEGDR
jgi:RNA polymerase sigma-70 factor, ECF subfamily